MLKRLVSLIVLLLVASACADEQPAATTVGPELVVTTTTGGPPETVPTTSSTTTAAPAETTATTSSTTTTTLPIGETELALTEIARGFEQPVLAVSPPDDNRLFIVDQPGRIWVLAGDEPELFLDINEDVVFGGEQGLLGLAFHPDFADNGRFFLNYTGDLGQTRIVEVASDRTTADPASQQTLLEIEQPARNHNGGMLTFGPDGYLWVGTGDGGAANDRFDQGQRPDTLLAALLRLDVSEPGEYTIPQDNPYLNDDTGAPEVYSFGLRNPWRFAIDGDTLYIADVGQRSVEEVSVISIADAKAANFGWPVFEGSDCFKGPCNLEDTVLPVVEYNHNDGCSITGGFVYQGDAIPELSGHFFYGDYCSGWVRSLAPDGEQFEWFGDSGSRSITSFGQDATGEIYVVTQNGSIFKIERA
ncbi:MAG: glucose dehydrogenase [Acidimicrobiia bacterium]|nr:glucose dehydrogenase [Acidimicrobiia bacterium]